MTFRDDVRAEVVAQFTQTYANEVIDALWLNLPDDETALSVVADRIRWEWWEGQPINGLPADEVRARVGFTGDAFLVYVDDQLVYFQTHDPLTEGLAPLDRQSQVPQAFVGELRETLAKTVVAAQATELLQRFVDQQEGPAVPGTAQLRLPPSRRPGMGGRLTRSVAEGG